MKALGVASGKGGVGKTYVAATIIQDLLARGYRVGAADFDISNPNLGRMLQVTAEAEVDINKKIHPAETPEGLQFFSIEHVLRDKGIGMTGEEYAAIIKDVVEQGLWHVDYFVVDLPAVISNEFRAVIALFSENYVGTVVVAQPSHLATAERVLKLHELNGIPVIGIVENMTDFVCINCNTSYKIFGESGADALGEKYHVPVLAKLPVTMTVQERLREHMPVRIVDAAQVKVIGDAVVGMEPRKLGFMQEITQKVKHYVRDEVIKLLTTSLIIINSSVNVGELQRLHNFMQKQVIKFVIMDDKMENPVAVQVYRVANGKIMYLDESDSRVDNPDVWIYIRAAALAWAFLGKKKFPDGKEVPYDIMDAWANDDARVYGPGAVARAIAFYRDLWYQSREQITPRLAPLLEKLI